MMPLPKIKTNLEHKDKNGVKRLSEDEFLEQLCQQNGKKCDRLVKLVKLSKVLPELEVGDDLTLNLRERVQILNEKKS